MNKTIKALALTGLLYPFSSMATPTVVTDYTDLDFGGDFIYALNFNGSGSQLIGDATFTNVLSNGTGAPAGVSVTNFNRNTIWGGASNLGSDSDNNSLESIMRTIIWSNGLNPGGINLDVTSGTDYRLQLLYSEGCCNNRNFDVSAEGGLFQDEVKGTSVGGTVWQASAIQGYAMAWDFTAQDSSLDISFLRQTPGDSNYLISGLTLEKVAPVPEPSVVFLFGAGLLGMATFIRRKTS